MRNISKISVFTILTGFFGFILASVSYAGVATPPMTLKSDSFVSGSRISLNQAFNGWGSNGKNLSPQLSWSGVPPKAKSLAITMYDPDAPTGSGWWHWIVYDIPASFTSLPEGASTNPQLVGGTEGPNDYGTTNYGGPCPPPGDKPHRYIITLWALNIEKLPLGEKVTPAMIGFYLNQHKISKATITGLYSR